MYNELIHYGIPRRSGRYKWGSGKDPYHHGSDGGQHHNKKPSTEQLNDIIAKGNAKDIRKNFEYMSDKELSRAVMRANYKKQLMNIDHKDVKSGKEKFESAVTLTGKTMKFVNDTFKTANNVADFYADPFGIEKRRNRK